MLAEGVSFFAFFLTGQTGSADWPDPVRPGLASFFMLAAGETTGQTGSDWVWPFKRMQPLIKKIVAACKLLNLVFAVTVSQLCHFSKPKLSPVSGNILNTLTAV